MNMKDARWESSCLRAESVGSDAAFFGPPTTAKAIKYPYVIVRMKTNKSDLAQLFWITSTIPESEATSFKFGVRGDNQFHEYKLNVSRVRTWRGVITRLRLDPTNQIGAVVEVDYIKFAEQ